MTTTAFKIAQESRNRICKKPVRGY